MELTDLTSCLYKGNFLKEMLRWREVFGGFYLSDKIDKVELEKFLEVLVSLDSGAYRMLN